ncbi:hypothetical protein [Nonomuraea polychroma]|uniref:hypothetical protein n=1 Tax=Nonomuraea polychroma TaxID=46176 RepID=UPI001F4D3E08|nr:hypothetical protein [Nonomuraea polychroma]
MIGYSWYGNTIETVARPAECSMARPVVPSGDSSSAINATPKTSPHAMTAGVAARSARNPHRDDTISSGRSAPASKRGKTRSQAAGRFSP